MSSPLRPRRDLSQCLRLRWRLCPLWSRHSQSQFHVGHATATPCHTLVTPQPITVPPWSHHSQSFHVGHATANHSFHSIPAPWSDGKQSLCQFSGEAMAAQAPWNYGRDPSRSRPKLSRWFEYQGVPMPDQTRRAVPANLTSLHGIFADPATLQGLRLPARADNDAHPACDEAGRKWVM